MSPSLKALLGDVLALSSRYRTSASGLNEYIDPLVSRFPITGASEVLPKFQVKVLDEDDR